MSPLSSMDILILHQQIDEQADASERDVLVQAEAVSAAVSRMGHRPRSLACTLDLQRLQRKVIERRPDCVFNLVESLDGSDRLMPLVPLLLEQLQIPYTGSSAVSIVQSSDKLSAKHLLRTASLPTPGWSDGEDVPDSLLHRPVIVKAIHEHASFGLDNSSIQTFHSASQLREVLDDRLAATGQPHFAEEFIDGREFNVSLLAGSRGPVVLPPAEIDFSFLPSESLRIVGYAAKWEEDSAEYVGTPRRFDLPEQDRDLVGEIQELCRRCWNVFGLNGYARVDFRVDTQRRPWILEINGNPCLAPDAGFAAALGAAGLSYDAGLQKILQNCVHLGRQAATERFSCGEIQTR